jgi:hypothetical protein
VRKFHQDVFKLLRVQWLARLSRDDGESYVNMVVAHTAGWATAGVKATS